MIFADALKSLLPAVERVAELVKLEYSAVMIVFTASHANPCLKPNKDTHASYPFADRSDHDRDDFFDECGW